MKRFEAETLDPSAGKIYFTKDYSKFKIDKRNRPVDIKRATQLYKELMADPDMTIEPIVVNKTFTIIDGQHRFWAIRKAKQTLYWYMDRKLTIKDAILLNSKGQHWDNYDYVSAYANSGFIDYKKLQHVINRFRKDFALSVIEIQMSPLAKQTKWINGSGVETTIVKHGDYEFDFDREKINKKFLEYLVSLKPVFKLRPSRAINRSAVSAIRTWYFNPNVDKNRLIRVLNAKWYVSLRNSDDMNALSIGTLYNKRLKRNKIECYVDMNGNFHFAK